MLWLTQIAGILENTTPMTILRTFGDILGETKYVIKMF